MAINPGIGFHALQKLQRLLRLLGFVALVVLPENLVRRGINNDCFYRSRTHVETDEELRYMIVRLLRVLHLLDRRLGFDAFDLNQRWTFVALVVHHSSLESGVVASCV